MLHVFAILFLCTSALASENAQWLRCPRINATEVIVIATGHSSYDKNNHCAVSCMLALRCSPREALLAGYLKELKDILGPGNAEVLDIRANRRGIDFVKTGKAVMDSECLAQCDLYYP